ncbi:unnamed protein product [Rotaria magnacalcarata]
MPWFKGYEGRTVCKTFLEILDVIIQLRRFVDKPLRLSVQDIYKVSGIGTVVVGRVDTGVLKIAMLNSPSEIELGDKFMVYCHTARITCQLVEFLDKIDYQTGKTIEASSKFIKSGDLATVKLVLLQPAGVENFQEYPSLGHFTIRQMNHTVAVGITKDVENMTTVSYDNPTSNIDMYY